MIYHVYANQSNAGDWLSAIGIQSVLAPLQVEECFCDEPFVPETLAKLSAAGPEDFIVIGGGGLFMDYFTPFWEGFQPIARRIPFAIWGAGCCDMKLEETRLPLSLIGPIIRQSRLCVVRDELTRSMLSASKLPPPVMCPTVVAVETSGPGRTGSILHVDHYDNVGEEIHAEMCSAARDFASSTGRAYRQINNLLPSGNPSALRSVMDTYVAADLVLTSRLHGCIIALATGRPVLAVSGDRKVESFMAAMGLSEWVCDLDESSAVRSRLETLHEQKHPVALIRQGRLDNRLVADRVRSMQPVGTSGPAAQ